MRARIVPVVTTDKDGLASEIVAGETKVVSVERAINIQDLAEVARNSAVEANLAAGMAPQVAAEPMETRVPLLEDDGLGLNLADLLSDDSKKFLDEYQVYAEKGQAMYLLAISWRMTSRCWMNSIRSVWQTTSRSCLTITWDSLVK
jgi:hypothetical protein